MSDKAETQRDAIYAFAEKAGEIVRKVNGDDLLTREFDPDAEGLVEIEVRDMDELTQLYLQWRALRHMGR